MGFAGIKFASVNISAVLLFKKTLTNNNDDDGDAHRRLYSNAEKQRDKDTEEKNLEEFGSSLF